MSTPGPTTAATPGKVDIELGKLSQADLDRKPWKYFGYHAFASYLASSDDAFVLRRFDNLHCRILLRLQDQLTEHEEELNLIDAEFSEKSAKDVDNGSFRNDQKKRRDVLEAILAKLEQYDGLLVNFLTLKDKPPAPKLNRRNVKRWLENRRNPIQPKEAEFINADDLITSANSPKSALRHTFEQYFLAPTNGLCGLLAQKQPQLEGGIQTTVIGNDEQVEVIATVAIFLTALVMLIAPLWTLAVVQDMFKKLGAITAFLFLFLTILVCGTLARPFEILAATAGYSAVLVVFLQFSRGLQEINSQEG